MNAKGFSSFELGVILMDQTIHPEWCSGFIILSIINFTYSAV